MANREPMQKDDVEPYWCDVTADPDEVTTSVVHEGDRSYSVVPTPYWCDFCGQQGVPSMREGVACLRCGEEQWEPFREGWD